MSNPTLRDLISKGIRQSEVRARKIYAADAASILQRYSVLKGFLEKISRFLVHWPRIHILYFPLRTPRIYSAYREMGFEHFKIVEMRDRLASYRQIVQDIMDNYSGEQIASIQCDLNNGNNKVADICVAIPKLVKSVLSERVTDSFLRDATNLVIFLRVPSAMYENNPKWYQDLTGLLILLVDKGYFNKIDQSDVGLRLYREFERYLETIRRFSGYESEFFIPSLVDHDARIQESAVRGMGYATYMLQHRFRNLRQAAQYVGEHFKTIDDVKADPITYAESIKDMSLQLEEALGLENILRNLAERPQVIPQTVEEIKEIFESLFNHTIQFKNINAKLEIDIKPSLLPCMIVTPHRLIDEVFLIHIDNSLHEIARKHTVDKRLILEIYEQSDYVCFTMVNFGPSIPPDVMEDLERVVRVRQPQRTGLGVFLSAMMLQQVGGTMHFHSPVRDGIGASVTLRFRKYEQGGLS